MQINDVELEGVAISRGRSQQHTKNASWHKLLDDDVIEALRKLLLDGNDDTPVAKSLNLRCMNYMGRKFLGKERYV